MGSRLFFIGLAFVLCLSACSQDAGSSASPDASSDAGSAEATGDTFLGVDGQPEEGDACWWCTDADPSTAPDTLAGTSSGKGEGGKGEGLLLLWKGTLDLTTFQGTYVSQVIPVTGEKSDEVYCEVNQPITNATALDDCEACEFAYGMSMEIVPDDQAVGCNDFTKQDTSFSFGHSENGVHGYKDGSWVLYGDVSAVEDDVWTFQFSYFLGGGDKDDGKDGGEDEIDEACYDACIEKGGSEAVCIAACGDGEDGDGKDGDRGK